MCLLSTRNLEFARLFVTNNSTKNTNNSTKIILLNNAGVFISQTFNGCCMSVGITVEDPIAMFTRRIAY